MRKAKNDTARSMPFFDYSNLLAMLCKDSEIYFYAESLYCIVFEK